MRSIIESVSQMIKGSVNQNKPQPLPPARTETATRTGKDSSQLILPIFITGSRSGSTLTMELLSADTRCALERFYPYEAKYLAWFARSAAGMDGWRFLDDNKVPELQVNGAFPTHYRKLADDSLLIGLPSGAKIFKLFFESFQESILAKEPEKRFYLEKGPPWLAIYLRRYIDAINIYLWRDPRDRYISTSKFLRKKHGKTNYLKESDPEYDYVLYLVHGYLRQFENFRVTQDGCNTFDLRYEQLIEDPLAALEPVRKICAINPAFQPSYDNYDIHRTSKTPQDSIARWKRGEVSPEAIACIDTILQEAITDLNYELSDVKHKTESPVLYFDSERKDSCTSLDCTDGNIAGLSRRGLHIKVTGSCFHFKVPLNSFDAAKFREVWVSFSGELGYFATVYWRAKNQVFEDSRCVQIFTDPGSHYSLLRFELHKHPEWHGQIEELQINLFNGKGWDNPNKRGYIRMIRLIPVSFQQEV